MTRALGLMFLATLLWPILENTGISLMGRHHPVDVVFLRYSAHLLLLLPFVLARGGVRALATGRPILQLARGVAMAGMPICWLLASGFATNDWVWTVFWAMPALALIGAALFLRDFPSPAAWTLVMAGIAGTMLIRQTFVGGGSVVGTLLAIGMAGTFASYIVLSRILRDERIEASLFYSAVGALVPTTALVWMVWTPLLPGEVVPALAVGALSIAILGVLDLSLESATVSAVAPMLVLVPIWEMLVSVPLHGANVYTTHQLGMILIAATAGVWLWRHPGLRAGERGTVPGLAMETEATGTATPTIDRPKAGGAI